MWIWKGSLPLPPGCYSNYFFSLLGPQSNASPSHAYREIPPTHPWAIHTFPKRMVLRKDDGKEMCSTLEEGSYPRNLEAQWQLPPFRNLLWRTARARQCEDKGQFKVGSKGYRLQGYQRTRWRRQESQDKRKGANRNYQLDWRFHLAFAEGLS